ncbi:MAG: hypothetical protein P8J87_09825, partial [Verrucomicrobiales bacterium]|nr:hypothetical protein [Verrucomicrobiales bacterium]
GDFIAPTVATNSGDLDITGNSPNATGIRIETPSSVRTQSGNVTLTGRGGSPDRQIVAMQGISIDQNSGTFTFDGQLESPSLTTSPGSYETRFLSAANIGSGVTFNNSGGLTVDASLDIDGDLTANAGPTNLRGSITTGYDSIRLGHVDLIDGLPSRSIGNSVPDDPSGGSGGISTLINIDSISAPQAAPLAFGIQASPDTDITIGDLDPAARMSIVSGRDASISSNTGLDIDAVNISGDLNLTAADDITAGANTSVSSISASSTAGSIDLDSSFDRVQNLFAAGNISAFSDRVSPVTVDGSIASTGGDILLFASAGDLTLSPSASIQTPGDIVLGSANNFSNSTTAPSAVQSGGRTLVYTASVEGVTLGAISVDATEYGKTFPDLPDTDTGNILLTINDDVVDPPVVDPPTTPPSTPENTADNPDRPDRPDRPGTTAGPPTTRVALLDLIRRSAPRGSPKPEEDNPVNPIAANPRHLVAQLDSSRSSDILPPRAAPRPFFGAPFAGYLFSLPGSDLSLSPEFGPVTFGSGGTFGTSDASVPKELLESLSDPAVKELNEALQNP